MKNLLLLSLFAILFIASACEKYEEGPSLSLRSKKARVANEWKVIYAYDYKDNVDITSDYSGETWEFAKDGQFSEKDNGEVDKTGTWDFLNDKEEIAINFPADIKKYRILRLKENEMWLMDHEEELHLVTNN